MPRFNTTKFWALFTLALPLILANITTPLLGLIDTAILGHMPGVHFLAGASIASLILTQLYWLCGFLKMSITGLSAQRKTASQEAKAQVLMQGLAFALGLGLLILLAQHVILHAGLYFAQASATLQATIQTYFTIRVWGAPAALMNMVLMGWLVGQQRTRSVLVLQVIINIVNIIASLCFVYVFDMQVAGVALGTVVAEYTLLIFAALHAIKQLGILHIKRDWFAWAQLSSLIHLNSHIFVRNLMLQLTLAFVTLQGARYGELAAASNAIIMQFFALIALGLDGIANALEAKVGEAKGEQNIATLGEQVQIGLVWSSIIAVAYSLAFMLFDQQIIAHLTELPQLHDYMSHYQGIIWLLPLIAHWCFLYDGVFVGLTKARAMQYSMMASTLLVFFPVWYSFKAHGNQALWWALLAFLAARGLSLACVYHYSMRVKPTHLMT